MGEYRSTARIVGVLFILASLTAIVGGLLLAPAVEADALREASSHGSAITVGALLELVLALSVVAIAAWLFPVLRREHEGAALAYVGARIVEGLLILAGTVSALLSLTLSRGFTEDGSAAMETSSTLLLAARDWTYWLGPMAVFGVGAVILNVLLYRADLVPRWLSLWGVIGAVLLFASALLEMFGQTLGGLQAVFTAPIGLQEMVFAVLLIWKGFTPRPTAVETEERLVESHV